MGGAGHMSLVGRRRWMAAIVSMAITLTALASVTAAGAATGWKWAQPYQVPGLTAAVNALSCPSTSLCLAISSNKVYWTTNPTGKASSWKRAALEPVTQPGVMGSVGLVDLSCPSAAACVVVDNLGNSFVSTAPARGGSSWKKATISANGLKAVGCASRSLCAALDISGGALTTTTPFGGTPWAAVAITGTANAGFYGVSCGGSALCAAVEADNHVYYTINPGAPQAKWQVAKLGGAPLDDIACPKASLCVAVGNYGSRGRIAVSGNPARGSWKSATIGSASLGFNELTCHSASLCVALSGSSVFTSTHPSAKASAWHQTTIAGIGSETAVSCPSTSLCLVGSSTNQVSVGRAHR